MIKSSQTSERASCPPPESSHAIRAAIDEALKCKETGEEKTIVFGLTGTGYFDMGLREVPRWPDERLHPHRCRPAKGL